MMERVVNFQTRDPRIISASRRMIRIRICGSFHHQKGERKKNSVSVDAMKPQNKLNIFRGEITEKDTDQPARHRWLVREKHGSVRYRYTLQLSDGTSRKFSDS